MNPGALHPGAASDPSPSKGGVVNTAVTLRLELPFETLRRLLAGGLLCAQDFRCLDCETKSCVWRLLLMNATKSIDSETACNGCCDDCPNRRVPESATSRLPRITVEAPCAGDVPGRLEGMTR